MQWQCTWHIDIEYCTATYNFVNVLDLTMEGTSNRHKTTRAICEVWCISLSRGVNIPPRV